MKVLLMHRNCDFRLGEGLPPSAGELTQDLELDTLFDAMAAGDGYLREAAKNAVLASVSEPETILYRQQALADCLEFPKVAREIYAIAVDAIQREKRVWSVMWDRYPEAALHRATEVLRIFVKPLRRLWQIATDESLGFRSEAFTRLFAMIASELDGEYMQSIEEYLERLEFHSGVLMSAELGSDCKGTNYILRKQSERNQSWLEWLQGWVSGLAGRTDSVHVYEVDDRDEAGFRALGDLRVQGIRHVASALAQSTDHILSFFNMLRLEMGFYISCINLHEQMTRKREPLCMPQPFLPGQRKFQCSGLYDICLSLRVAERVVGNDVAGDGRSLVMITGANRGGKSTFLRSAGLAHLMMQCGMFVPAEAFHADLCQGVFTHFKREEDATMKSGKLDEELARMSAIIEKIIPHSLVLLNESFSSTNEREGSEIARQIVRALLQTEVKIFYVTHMFDLAEGFYRERTKDALFLRAERLEDGRRTFLLPEGEPLPTSYGEDLYMRIFEPDREPAADACSQG